MEAKDICPDCNLPTDQCLCCEGCGHVCSLDLGEPFCPVCKPAPQTSEK